MFYIIVSNKGAKMTKEHNFSFKDGESCAAIHFNYERYL